MMKNPKIALKRSGWLLFIGVIVYVLSSFYLMEQSQSPELIIGSKNFTESVIIAEYYAQTLENAGYRVQRKFNLGGTFIAHQALQRGQIDLYPEYSGTAFLDIIHQEPPFDSRQSHAILDACYQKRWGVRWLDFSPADNSFALVLRRVTADHLHLKTVSDLAMAAPKLTLGSIPEFEERVDGLPGLKRKYGGFQFKHVDLYDNGLKYQVLKDKRVDVTVGFTTDGPLADSGLVSLADDKHFWPDYHVAPLVRQGALNRIPSLQHILNDANSQLTNSTLQRLNAAVDLKHQDIRRVVHDYILLKKSQVTNSKLQLFSGTLLATNQEH
jgi:osmoprotectant transport system substrate-binding protein